MSHVMSGSELPRAQNEFCSADAVEKFFGAKFFEVDEKQAECIIDTLKELGKFKGQEKLGTLLDLGCGYGIATTLLAKHFHRAIGIDISVKQIKKAQQICHSNNVEFKTGSGDNLPIDDVSVDVITSVFSVQHFDVDRFIKECRRVLKPGGVVIIYSAVFSELTSSEDDKLPVIDDVLKEMYQSLKTLAKARQHAEYLHLDGFKTVNSMIDWPGKSRIQRKGYTTSKLSALYDLYSSIPFFASLGTTPSSPLVRAFQEIRRIWKLEASQDMDITATLDATLLVLKN